MLPHFLSLLGVRALTHLTRQNSSLSMLPNTTLLPSGQLNDDDPRHNLPEQTEQQPDLGREADVEDDGQDLSSPFSTHSPSSWQNNARIR